MTSTTTASPPLSNSHRYGPAEPPRRGATNAPVTPAGAPSASRVVFTCNPNLPRGERTFQHQFRTECVAPPSDQFRLGSALNDEYLGPGYMNWDISVFKNVPWGGGRRLQFRVELYNAFDSDQWTTVNNTANFDYTTGALTNPTVFGSLTGVTLSARRIQLGARLIF